MSFDKTKNYIGHRARLREKFRESGGKSLSDYETLELFLFFCVPCRDTKQIAKRLLKAFGSIDSIIFSDESKLLSISGVGQQTALALRVCGELSLRRLREKLKAGECLNSLSTVIDYCRASNAYKTTENVHVIFLNVKNNIIADEIMFSGTVDHTQFYVREIIKRALDLNASAIILVHNHPSDDVTPSTSDIDATRMLSRAAKAMDITLHDHLIVTKQGYTSLRNLGVLT
jgi:DNA repair protein RadC